MEQAPLYDIFINLQKAYDAMDRESCMEIVRGHGVGPNVRRLLQFFWDNTELVAVLAVQLVNHSRIVEESHRVAQYSRPSSILWWMISFGNGFDKSSGTRLLAWKLERK